jgi:hypothetical protein
MTMITFSLSATFPGQTPGQPWDADWVEPVALMDWTDTFYARNGSQDDFYGDGATYKQITGNSVNLGLASPDLYDVDHIGFWFDPRDFAIVNIINYEYPDSTSEQEIKLATAWNSIKDIEVSSISSLTLSVIGFVDTWINAPTDDDDHWIYIMDAKRGAVALGDGNDSVEIDAAANEYTWQSHFDITLGNGNDTVTALPYFDVPAKFNTEPQLTTADITLGNGNDTITLVGLSGTIRLGDGDDTINIASGNSTLWLGGGTDTVNFTSKLNPDIPWPSDVFLDSRVGSSVVHVGEGHADITIYTSPILPPTTTIDFIHGETGGNTSATADVIRYGYVNSTGSFVGGDLSALTIDLIGYSPGSTVSLADAPPGGPALMQIHDAVSGSIDAVTIYAGVTGSAVLQHVQFT